MKIKALREFDSQLGNKKNKHPNKPFRAVAKVFEAFQGRLDTLLRDDADIVSAKQKHFIPINMQIKNN